MLYNDRVIKWFFRYVDSKMNCFKIFTVTGHATHLYKTLTIVHQLIIKKKKKGTNVG